MIEDIKMVVDTVWTACGIAVIAYLLSDFRKRRK